MKLVDYVEKSFEKDPNGNPVQIKGEAYQNNDSFGDLKYFMPQYRYLYSLSIYDENYNKSLIKTIMKDEGLPPPPPMEGD